MNFLKRFFLLIILFGSIGFLNVSKAQTYCFPGFQMACFYGDQITRVVFAGINHFDNVCNNDADGKKDFTSSVAPAEVVAGSTYTLTVTFSVNSSVGAIAWFDFNDDGIFQTTEYFNLGTRTSNGDLSVSIPIPANAAIGNTRFRVMNRKNNVNPMPGAGDACHSISNYRGQMKDYAMNISSGSGLPVELLSFKAFQDNSAINLEWTTQSERDNEFFFVQHSVDGTNWESLKEVESQGNSSDEQFYRITDSNPAPGVNYYQLSQKDKNGAWKFLDKIAVNLASGQLVVYPNPCFGELKVSGLERNSVLTVFNAVWEEEKRYQFPEKQAEVTLELSDLNPGIYFLVVEGVSAKKTFKVVRE